MAARKPATEISENNRRLLRLMGYFGVNQSQMARLLGMTASTINRAIADGGVSRELQLAICVELGVGGDYWRTDRRDSHGNPVANANPDPARFLTPGEEAWRARSEAFARAGLPPPPAPPSQPFSGGQHEEGEPWQFSIAKLAAERRDPPEVISALLTAVPTEGTPPKDVPMWWLRTYFSLLEKHGVVRKAK